MNRVTSEPLVLAADVGGTSTRVLIAPADADPAALPLTADGAPAPTARGSGANIRSGGLGALGAVRATTARALQALGAHGEQVRAAVLGMSGAGPARRREITQRVRSDLAELGISPEVVEVRDDLITAFLSGGVSLTGVLLLAGTGAAAVRVDHGVAVARRDGMGWLLGDVGSAVWIGRRIVEGVAADLDHRGHPTELTSLLQADLGLPRAGSATTGDPRQDLIRALDPLRPSELGRFAPLAARASSDPVAQGILHDAAAHLLAHVEALDGSGTLPVVLAGSVVATDGPVRETVHRRLEASGRRVVTARDGLLGALTLAHRLLQEPRHP
ncbi:N-acetylglucosamine kinase [Brachybacterium sp. EF45031]|uniref:N-acetylglucosamine kinase n=1 Tax=Brachybacterium sillae TaxID=2810536 RepID=UPI00217EE138|nr:BadF/BadG/BcrA/BcrD ATPase family protein [Brachybacterium sillae]MCS6712191.1 N-acetylglucosamine kinase [Brachybacterium sillae]